MHRSNSSRVQPRGSASLLVLVMVTVLLNLAFAHYTAVSLALKTGQAHGLHPEKDNLLGNLPQIAALENGEESGTGGVDPTAYAYERGSFAHAGLETTSISVRFTQQPSWPRRQGLWLRQGDWQLFVHDYWED